MVTFTHTRELKEAQFVDVDLRGARFVEADLSGVVMRAVEVSGADIEAPWLIHGKSFLVNGVDVIPLVEATLNQRFPGRADRRADDPDGLRAAWTALESTWTQTMRRVAAMPADSVDMSVDGEWSFAQTLRHLILATDTWLGRGVLQLTSRSIPSDWRGPVPRTTAWTCRSSPPTHPRTPTWSRSEQVASPWCATISPRSPPPSWPPSAPTRGHQRTGDRPFLSARDLGGGVGAPPLRRPGPGRDRIEVRPRARWLSSDTMSDVLTHHGQRVVQDDAVVATAFRFARSQRFRDLSPRLPRACRYPQ